MPLLSDDSDRSSDFAPEPEIDGENVDSNADEGSDDEPRTFDDEDDDYEGGGGNIFDMEAVESDGSDAYDEEHDDQISEHGEPRYFPQFTRLPIEMRMKIWENFCPDLTADSRVFDLSDVPGSFSRLDLAAQTLPVRTVMAVDQESRRLALKSLPHTLALTHEQWRFFIHFNRDKDIVVAPERGLEAIFSLLVPGFTDQIVNLAINCISPNLPAFESQDNMPRPGNSGAFPRLKHLFVLSDHEWLTNDLLHWCVSDKAKSYLTSLRDWMDTTQVSSRYQVRWVWPDLDRYRDDFAREMFALLDRVWMKSGLPNYPDHHLLDEDGEVENVQVAVAKQLKSFAVWPLVMFVDDSGISRFERMLALKTDKDWEELSDFIGSDASEPDEYESSGIDDSDIEEPESSDSEDDLHVLDDGDSVDKDGSDAEDPSFEGYSPASQNGGVLLEEGGTLEANFSGPEPESETADDDDTDANVGGRALKHRKRVLESDDEQSEDEAPRKRLRHQSRDARRIDSDENESAGENVEEEDVDEESEIPIRRRDRHPAVQDDNEESDEESDDSEVDLPDPKRMSLAQKLQLHREQNPIFDNHDEEESDEMEGEAGGGFYYGDQADFQDDDEGDDIGEGAENGYAVNFDEDEDEEY